MKRLIIPIFIPHLGCPYRCVFCNQHKITQEDQRPTASLVQETALLYVEAVKNKHLPVEIAFYGGSFTGVSTALQEELLQAAWELKEQNIIQAIRLSTRPDYINQQVLDRLLKYSVDTVELGVQSLDAQVLKISGRGHGAIEVRNALTLLKANNIQVGLQLMPGLPGDNWEKIKATTCEVVNLVPDFVRIYPTLVIKGTLLEHWFSLGNYQPLSLEEAVEITAKMVIILEKAGILIIRIGLQAQENLSLEKDLVAGPYHPAFGELVKSRVFRKQMEYLLQVKSKLSPGAFVTIYCAPQDISQVKGQKNINIAYFQEKYSWNLRIKVREGLSRGNLALEDWRNNQVLSLSREVFLTEESSMKG